MFPTLIALTISPQPISSHHFAIHMNISHKLAFFVPYLPCTTLHFSSYHFTTLLDAFHFTTLLDDFYLILLKCFSLRYTFVLFSFDFYIDAFHFTTLLDDFHLTLHHVDAFHFTTLLDHFATLLELFKVYNLLN
jgi:hypothetical protein